MSYKGSFAVACAMLLHICAACADEKYPLKPIRIVTSPAGGAADLVSRLIAREISGPLGQPVIIENRGGDIAIAAGIVAKSAADGYTLLLHGVAFLVTPLMRENPPYDLVRDFEPITMVATSPNVVVIHPSVAATSIKELVALAKSRPGILNYASAGTGSSAHLAAELFKALAGVAIAHVPFRGTAPAVVDLVGGQVQMMFVIGGVATPHIKSGRLRAIAVTSAQPSELFPGLPTVAASGLPGYEMGASNSVFAPAGTPEKIIQRINTEIARAVKTVELKERLFNAGTEVVSMSVEQFRLSLKVELTRFGKLIKDTGIREQ